MSWATSMRTSKVVRVLGGFALVVGGLSAAVGFLHTEAGRPWLHRVASMAGCPVDFEGGDPAKVEAFRRAEMEKHLGFAEARSRPAFGFELGSSRADVRASLSARGISCEAARKGSVLSCADVQTASAHKVSRLHLQFDGKDRLVALDLYRETACAGDALRALSSTRAELERAVGPVTETVGLASGEFLEAAGLRRYAERFEYSDYVAELSAMNYGARGVRVRERYQWLPQGG